MFDMKIKDPKPLLKFFSLTLLWWSAVAVMSSGARPDSWIQTVCLCHVRITSYYFHNLQAMKLPSIYFKKKKHLVAASWFYYIISYVFICSQWLSNQVKPNSARISVCAPFYLRPAARRYSSGTSADFRPVLAIFFLETSVRLPFLPLSQSPIWMKSHMYMHIKN